ncbi:hypothetical protein I7I48_05724 [Histoplasma ohiense]|nr:hypothetical protein I7I48_05724 [Histoplasma ohiense (nom. inval.)]
MILFYERCDNSARKQTTSITRSFNSKTSHDFFAPQPSHPITDLAAPSPFSSLSDISAKPTSFFSRPVPSAFRRKINLHVVPICHRFDSTISNPLCRTISPISRFHQHPCRSAWAAARSSRSLLSQR